MIFRVYIPYDEPTKLLDAAAKRDLVLKTETTGVIAGILLGWDDPGPCMAEDPGPWLTEDLESCLSTDQGPCLAMESRLEKKLSENCKICKARWPFSL